MRARPRGAAGREKHLLQPSDRQRVELTIAAAIAAALERLAHSVVDERRPPDLADRERQQFPPRLFAQQVVARAADNEVALLERVGKREQSTRIGGVHDRNFSTLIYHTPARAL